MNIEEILDLFESVYLKKESNNISIAFEHDSLRLDLINHLIKMIIEVEICFTSRTKIFKTICFLAEMQKTRGESIFRTLIDIYFAESNNSIKYWIVGSITSLWSKMFGFNEINKIISKIIIDNQINCFSIIGKFLLSRYKYIESIISEELFFKFLRKLVEINDNSVFQSLSLYLNYLEYSENSSYALLFSIFELINWLLHDQKLQSICFKIINSVWQKCDSPLAFAKELCLSGIYIYIEILFLSLKFSTKIEVLDFLVNTIIFVPNEELFKVLSPGIINYLFGFYQTQFHVRGIWLFCKKYREILSGEEFKQLFNDFNIINLNYNQTSDIEYQKICTEIIELYNQSTLDT